jgi:hypothetical protein
VAPVGLPIDSGRLEAGPVQPGDEVRDELRALLMADESRLGQFYRCLEEGLDADAIAEKFEVEYPSFVWNYRRLIKALMDGDLPSAPTVALAASQEALAVSSSSPAPDSLMRSQASSAWQ